MHNYVYVTKAEAAPVKQQLINLLHEVQDLLREDFTFQYRFIGSSSRNMITRDDGTNRGFDFDINIEVNTGEDEFSAEQIKKKLMQAFDKKLAGAWPLFNKNCEDSTRVITIKKVDRSCFFPHIEYSCDIAVVRHRGKRSEFIHLNKEQRSYTWKKLTAGYDLEQKVAWLRENGHWNEVRERYLNKKNENDNPDKHSRSLYAEAVNEICQQHGYHKA